MFKHNFIILLIYYLLKSSLEESISNTYDIFEQKPKKKIVPNFKINFNSSLNETKEIIINYKNDEDPFNLNNQTYIIFPSNNQEFSNYADEISLYIKNYTGLEILVAPNVIRKTSNKNKNTFIQIVLNKEIKNIFEIRINRRKIQLISSTNIGIIKSILLFKYIITNNFKKNDTIYENIEFPSVDIISKNDLLLNKGSIIISIILIIIVSLYFFIFR